MMTIVQSSNRNRTVLVPFNRRLNMRNRMKKAAAITMMAIGFTGAMQSANSAEFTIINPPEIFDPAPLGYSHVVVAHGSRYVFIAGQVGDPAAEFEKQVAQSYANLAIAIKAAGARPDQVAKLTTYIVNYDASMLPILTSYVKEMFGTSLPAQSLVPVPALALDGLLFEIDATAITD